MLEEAGLPMEGELRQTAGTRGPPPFQWQTLRTFVPVSANDKSEAAVSVATALALEPRDLVTYTI